MEERTKKIWDAIGSVAAGGLVYAAARNKRAEQEKREGKDPDIARSGEKVMAMEDISGSGINDTIIKGKIYTVSSYHLGSYYLKECEAVYNPYLGEYASQCFAAEKFKKVKDERE